MASRPKRKRQRRGIHRATGIYDVTFNPWPVVTMSREELLELYPEPVYPARDTPGEAYMDALITGTGVLRLPEPDSGKDVATGARQGGNIQGEEES